MQTNNKLQEAYDTLIEYADSNFKKSTDPLYKPLQREMAAYAECFEEAANYLHGKFPLEIRQATTLRFQEIREHHLSEE